MRYGTIFSKNFPLTFYLKDWVIKGVKTQDARLNITMNYTFLLVLFIKNVQYDVNNSNSNRNMKIYLTKINRMTLPNKLQLVMDFKILIYIKYFFLLYGDL